MGANQMSAVINAITEGKLEEIKEMVENANEDTTGSDSTEDINAARNAEGETALQVALKGCSSNIIKALLDYNELMIGRKDFEVFSGNYTLGSSSRNDILQRMLKHEKLDLSFLLGRGSDGDFIWNCFYVSTDRLKKAIFYDALDRARAQYSKELENRTNSYKLRVETSVVRKEKKALTNLSEKLEGLKRALSLYDDEISLEDRAERLNILKQTCELLDKPSEKKVNDYKAKAECVKETKDVKLAVAMMAVSAAVYFAACVATVPLVFVGLSFFTGAAIVGAGVGFACSSAFFNRARKEQAYKTPKAMDKVAQSLERVNSFAPSA